MRRTFRWALVLALAAFPAALRAQAPLAGAGAEEGAQAGAFQMLREHRAELGITDDQAERLRAIATRLVETNAPLREQLRQQRAALLAQRRAELVRMTPQQRQAELARLRAQGGQVPAEWRPLLEQMRANQRAAMREAQAVLTPPQKARARDLLRQWRAERGGRAQQARPLRRRWARP